jgi:Esterase/lipase
MSNDAKEVPITKRPVVLRIAGQDDVIVRRNVVYRDDLAMDLYYPPDSKGGARTPAVIFVTGYADPGFQKMLGCTQNEMASYVSWAELTAASGLVAVTYKNREPPADASAVVSYIRANAASLDIDENRIGVWSCSGNVPTALSVLMREGQDFLKCAVLCYGLMLDLDGETAVADASRQWKFANPSAGRSVDDLPAGLPLFIARAGKDIFPRLNETIDRFVIHALNRNLAITVVNHPDGPHAFDVEHDSETSREIIRQVLAFMRFHLLDASRETSA